MTVIEALIIILVVFLFYLVIEWGILNVLKVKIDHTLLVVIALLVAILLLAEVIPFPELGVGDK